LGCGVSYTRLIRTSIVSVSFEFLGPNVSLVHVHAASIEQPCVLPSALVTDGSISVQSPYCPARKVNPCGFSKWNAIVSRASSSFLVNLTCCTTGSSTGYLAQAGDRCISRHPYSSTGRFLTRARIDRAILLLQTACLARTS